MTVSTCYPSDTDWGTFDWSTATPEQLALRDLAEEFAWATLNRLTAGALATCPIRLRPAKWACRPGAYYLAPVGAPVGPFNPYIGLDGRWRNETHVWECGCDDTRIVDLPGVVGAIEYVQIGDTVLPPTAYRVDDGNRLIRQDGEGWPLRQDMYAIAGEDDTFVVSYYPGRTPGRLEKFAAGVLAMEFMKAQAGDKSCRLPRGTTQVTRNGTSVTIDPGLFDNKISGIPEVDSIVMLHNPNRLKQKSMVYSPDTINRTPVTTVGSWSDAVVPGGPGPDQVDRLVEDPDNPGYYFLGA
jgi:hypothetical protein